MDWQAALEESLAKAVGEQLPGCDADQMRAERLASLPAEMQETPVLEAVESLTVKIHASAALITGEEKLGPSNRRRLREHRASRWSAVKCRRSSTQKTA